MISWDDFTCAVCGRHLSIDEPMYMATYGKFNSDWEFEKLRDYENTICKDCIEANE